MKESFSGDELLKEHIRDMGPKLGPAYYVLWHDVTWLHLKWRQYCQLFAPSSEHISLLEKVASHSFAVIRLALSEDVILSSARLTDAPETGRGKHAQDNLTLRRLPALVDDEALRDELKRLLEAAGKACEILKARRDKWIAHRDLDLALKSLNEPLPGISFDDVESALGAIRGVMNRLEFHYQSNPVAYEHSTSTGGGVDSLVYYLRKGVRAVDRQLERLQAHKPNLPEDLES